MNAVLAELHAQGHNVNGITAYAKALVKTGRDQRDAYEESINRFLVTNPDAEPAAQRVVSLITVSDNATIAQYDKALSAYISSGDPAALSGVGGIVARDMVALAVRSGELSQADVDAGNINWEAVGLSPEAGAAAYLAPAPAPQTRADSFSFTAPTATAPAPVSQTQQAPQGFIRTATGYRAAPTGEQARREAGVAASIPGAVRTATGYRAPMTGEKLARWTGVPLAFAQGQQDDAAAAAE